MPIDINNVSNKTTQGRRTNEQSHVKIVSNDSAQSQKTASLSPDSVSLTDTALRIKTLSDQISRLPIVDTQKVEQIRNSFNDGTFEFNSERIAQKMISFERGLR